MCAPTVFIIIIIIITCLPGAFNDHVPPTILTVIVMCVAVMCDTTSCSETGTVLFAYQTRSLRTSELLFGMLAESFQWDKLDDTECVC